MGRPAITSKCLSSEDTCLSLQQQVSWLVALAASHTFSLFAMVSCDTPSTYSDRIAWDSHPIPFYLSRESTGYSIQLLIDYNKKEPLPQTQQWPVSANAKMVPAFLQMRVEFENSPAGKSSGSWISASAVFPASKASDIIRFRSPVTAAAPRGICTQLPFSAPHITA